ncbi:MAG: FAD-dependent thymidylate synthase [Myxococcota bacterium]
MASEEQQRAVAEARAAAPTPTRRPTVPALEDRLFTLHPVLDHGFVRVVDYMGDDGAVVQAARVSYGKGTKTARDDRGLIRYLVRHRHTTPLEMCEIKLHVKLPIFVARQWIRHRTANVNEISARYSILDREFYLPDPDQVKAQSSTNRQGRGEALTAEQAAHVREVLRRDAVQTFETYTTLLNDQGDGQAVDASAPQVARELARANLTLGTYTQWYWKIDLHNLLHFVGLRADPHAQYEIRVYAEVMADLIAAWVPHTWEAFVDYRQHAHTFSREEMELLRSLLAGGDPDEVLPNSSLSLRERRAFRAALKLGPPKRKQGPDGS